MKKCFFLSSFFIFFSILSNAQNICGSTFNPQIVQNINPDRYNRYIQLEQFTANYIHNLNNNQLEVGRLINPNSTIIIPVVVHVLHNGEIIGVGNNISDAQIQSQIDVLNEDFRRQNADRVNTPPAFAGVSADPNIEFRLACVDPNGNNTNGIHRVQAGVNVFNAQYNSDNSINELVTGIKFTAHGGVDAWPTDRYLNIWVCNIAPDANGQLLGYSQFPSDFIASPNTDGIVILNTAFGRVGNLRFQYDQGRTTTHEVGHWLNLFHIWGDDGAACTCSDQCDDTPNQGEANQSNCPGFPHVSCSNGPNGDMFMNYMDYTVDACKNIYTIDQTNRMRAVFAQGGPRASFLNNYFRLNDPTTNVVCTSTIITTNNPMCLPINWSVTGPATITPVGNSATVTRNGDGVATVTATAGGYTDSKTLTIGIPEVDFSVQPSTPNEKFCINSFGNFIKVEPQPIAGVTGFQWGYVRNGQLPPVVYREHGSYEQDFRFSLAGQYEIYARAENSCGLGNTQTLNISVSICGGSHVSEAFIISPNPTSDNIQVSSKDNSNTIQEIRITDQTGTLKKRFVFGTRLNSAQINISWLPIGIYYLQIFDGTAWSSTIISKK